MDNKLIAAIIAGAVFLIGMMANFSLNEKSNKRALENDEGVKEKFRALESKIVDLKFSMNSILAALEGATVEKDVDTYLQTSKVAYQDLREIWRKVTNEMVDLDKKQRQAIGNKIFNDVAILLHTIIIGISHLKNSKGIKEEAVTKMKNLIIRFQNELEKLIQMIVYENQMKEEK